MAGIFGAAFYVCDNDKANRAALLFSKIFLSLILLSGFILVVLKLIPLAMDGTNVTPGMIIIVIKFILGIAFCTVLYGASGSKLKKGDEQELAKVLKKYRPLLVLIMSAIVALGVVLARMY